MADIAFPLSALPIQPTSVELTERRILDTAATALLTMGRVPPMVHLIGPNVKPDCVCTECIYFTDVSVFMQSEEGRDVLAAIMPQLCQGMNIHTVITVTESWTVEGFGREKAEEIMRWKDEHGSLESHPDAMEAVSILVETKTGTRLALYPIIRAEDGTPTGLAEDTGRPEMMAAGRFANWLRPRPEEVN